MVEANKLKLGLFIVISGTILLGSLLALGLFNEFKEKNEIFTIFDESVQGLEEGAAIKYKGVTIGRVKQISILQKRYVRVDMETDPDSVIGENVNSRNQSRSERIKIFNDLIQSEVKEGLRCSLEISSIATGLKFIELTHIDLERKTEVNVTIDKEEKDKFIPAMKSVLSGAITNFDKTLSNIAKIDYEGIGEEAKLALINLNKILSNPAIQSLISKGDKAADELIIVAETLNKKINELKITELQSDISTLTKNTDQNINTLIKNTDKKLNSAIETLSAKVETSLDNIDNLVASLEKEVKAAKIAETTEIARKALDQTTQTVAAVESDAIGALKSAKTFMDSLSDLKTDISKTLNSIEGASTSLSGMRGDMSGVLKRFKVTLDSISSLIEYLEKDPSAIIRGKSTKR
ncbi:MAG: MlaD family protein [Lentisphaeraceae bacterium]|nr:MlaD family protein [Lentisphaeraceae bacterium]